MFLSSPQSTAFRLLLLHIIITAYTPIINIQSERKVPVHLYEAVLELKSGTTGLTHTPHVAYMRDF
jgi:hypothetical protein